jgi:hypothetical protein
MKNFFAPAIAFLFACACFACFVSGQAYGQYTARQLEALSDRVGKTYWVGSAENRKLAVLSAPRANAPSFVAAPDESFEVTDLIGQKTPNPLYKIKFASGKEGFISPDSFLEGLNLTILTVDPKADENRKAAAAAEEEKKRTDWIQSQPWSQAMKNAAMKKQALSGMSTGEVRKILGNPTRINRIKAPQNLTEEQWFYPDGNVVVFRNGLLNRVEHKENK